jgi:hypothetical protein
LCVLLGQLGRNDEIPGRVGQLRESLNAAGVARRGVMAELRVIDPEALKNRAA